MSGAKNCCLGMLLMGVAWSFAATAAASALNVPQIQVAPPLIRIYRCEEGKSLKVTYWNSPDGQGFALVPVDGRPMLFVDTLAASGARYVAGRYTWWTKGNRGDLYDIAGGADAAPIVAGCNVAVK